MATYQSVQSASIESDTLVITKPTGLAVGDLLVAGILVNNDGSSTVGLNTPSGWTLQESVNQINALVIAVFIKVADSADVAASDFTFTASGSSGTNHMIGHLVRVTDYAFVAGETSGSSSNTTTLTITGFTPSRANCLFLIFSGIYDSTARTTATYAIATSNPTWTEQAETTFNDTTQDSGFSVATASRPEATATGDITLTYSGNTSNRVNGIVVALAPIVNGSFSAPAIKTNAYALTPIQSVKVNAYADAPTTRIGLDTQWTNPDKSTTPWTNPNK